MDSDTVFENEAIRDTSEKISANSDSGEFTAKTICVMNGLDQNVTLILEGSCGVAWLPIGSAWVQNATSDGYQTVNTYFPTYRIKAQCSVAPTTGDLTLVILKTKG